jgi:hypothetical protein
MPTIHRFPGLTSSEVYADAQMSDTIKDGDVLCVAPNAHETHEGVVAVLVDAWPVRVHGGNEDGTDHAFHLLDHEGDFFAHGDNEKYRASWIAAYITSAA